MKYKVFVDGQEGTTGLQINERLEKRNDIEILKISPEKRKDPVERCHLLNEADIVFLCLPDAAAIESVSLIQNNRTKIIDASTAHRTNPDWVYGLPELNKNQRSLIRASRRVSNPGCFATGFILGLYPLIHAGIVPKDYPITCHAVSGYSGAGKKLIAQYENSETFNESLKSPRFYALSLNHKHLPEMQKVCDLKSAPLFTPIVANYYKGMTVAIPLVPKLFSKEMNEIDIQQFLSEYYTKYYNNEGFVKVLPADSDTCLDKGYFAATTCNGTNVCEICVFGNNDQILLMMRLDNLGKGASGAAIQNMNIMLGIDENIGLEV
jgi:N-acetyl-gamma-glutamyl-phosphate reductase